MEQLNLEARELITFLIGRMSDRADDLKLWDQYYEGTQQLSQLGLSLPPEMHRLATVINWPRMYVEEIEKRLEIEGFRVTTDSTGDQDRYLLDLWRRNRLHIESSLAHIDAMALANSYISVGLSDDPEFPLIAIESAHTMYADINPQNGEVMSALRLWDFDKNDVARRMTLYTPDETLWLLVNGGNWTIERHDIHDWGFVPIIPLVNRARLNDRQGKPEFVDIMGLTDAACRSFTNLQGAQELMATPQRYILGASEDLFQDADGNPVPTWHAYLANILAIPDSSEGAKVGQFESAPLNNYTDTINTYARIVSGLTGLPPHFLGLTSENPASAEAIRNAEARLIKTVERKQMQFGSVWSRVLYIASRMAGKDYEPRTIEVIWRNPATPTYAQMADAVVKLVQVGLLDEVTALEEMGYSPGRIEKIVDRKAASGIPGLAALLEGSSGGSTDVRNESGADQSVGGSGDAEASTTTEGEGGQ